MVAERSPERLGAALSSLLGHDEYRRLVELGRELPPETTELVCPTCKGAGWLRMDRPVGTADFCRLVECQCGIVSARKANVYRAASRIPVEYEDLDLTTYPDKRIAADVADWWYEPKSHWLMLSGDLGVGKTGLAIGLVKKALASGKSALYRPFVELLSDIRATYRTRDASEPDEADLVGACKAVDVLTLDDVGAERATGWAQERLFEILNHRYNERRRTVLTTNLGPADMEQHIGDRIVSRINGMATIYEIVGRNLREHRA